MNKFKVTLRVFGQENISALFGKNDDCGFVKASASKTSPLDVGFKRGVFTASGPAENFERLIKNWDIEVPSYGADYPLVSAFHDAATYMQEHPKARAHMEKIHQTGMPGKSTLTFEKIPG